MRKIIVFELVSVDGFFAGPNGEIDWFKTDAEFSKFSDEQTRTFDTLIFGHTTYEMMADYWTTPEAQERDPGVADVMRNAVKIVFSQTIPEMQERPSWKHIKVLRQIRPKEVENWKQEEGKTIAILGSRNIVQQFTDLGLIDEYRLLVNPVILGVGKYLFKDVNKTKLKLLGTRTFGNGNVLLTYRPA